MQPCHFLRKEFFKIPCMTQNRFDSFNHLSTFLINRIRKVRLTYCSVSDICRGSSSLPPPPAPPQLPAGSAESVEHKSTHPALDSVPGPVWTLVLSRHSLLPILSFARSIMSDNRMHFFQSDCKDIGIFI